MKIYSVEETTAMRRSGIERVLCARMCVFVKAIVRLCARVHVFVMSLLSKLQSCSAVSCEQCDDFIKSNTEHLCCPGQSICDPQVQEQRLNRYKETK